MRRALALAAVALAAGCGGPKDSEEPAPEARLPAAPAEVRQACDTAAREYRGTVLCPRTFLSSREPAELEFGGRPRAGACAWLAGIQLRGPAFHVLVGGQCRPLPLGGDGDRWPVDPDALEPDLGLVGTPSDEPGLSGVATGPVRPRLVRDDVEVRGTRAALVAYAPHPAAGTVHAGHQALVWNEGGEGVVLSAHFDADVPAALRLRLLRAVAESMRPVA